MFEAVALTVHFKDVDMVGKPVKKCACEALRPEGASPLVEWQVVSLRENAGHRTSLTSSGRFILDSLEVRHVIRIRTLEGRSVKATN